MNVKILFIQESDWLKRNPIIQHHLLELLTLRGHEVKVIDFELLWAQNKHNIFSKRQVLTKVNRVYKESKVVLIRPCFIKIPILDYISVLFSHKFEIDRQIREWSPDIIVGVAILNSFWGARAAKKAGIPFIYYWFELMHCLIPYKPFRSLGKLIETETLKKTDRVLTTSDSLKTPVSEMGMLPDHIQTLESGVSVELYNSNDKRNFIRSHYDIGDDDIVLFFMGWIYRFSGLKEVCIQLAKINNPVIKLLIVGEGDDYEELKKIQSKYDLKKQIILTGQKPLKEIPSLLSAADICLLPAYNNETMRDIIPGKIYEYMAASKPIISTALPGMINKFGMDNGIIFVNRPEDVIEKAIEIIKDGSYKNIGSKSREYIEKYSWNNIANTFEKILNEAIVQKKLKT